MLRNVGLRDASDALRNFPVQFKKIRGNCQYKVFLGKWLPNQLKIPVTIKRLLLASRDDVRLALCHGGRPDIV
jgi:hypothetical protein